MDYSPPGSSVNGDSPGQKTGVGSQSLLQGIFPTQGSNPGLPHCRRILYHLSHQGISIYESQVISSIQFLRMWEEEGEVSKCRIFIRQRKEGFYAPILYPKRVLLLRKVQISKLLLTFYAINTKNENTRQKLSFYFYFS